jgi:rubrerythrin
MSILAAAIQAAMEKNLKAEEIYRILRDRYSDPELHAAFLEVAGRA